MQVQINVLDTPPRSVQTKKGALRVLRLAISGSEVVQLNTPPEWTPPVGGKPILVEAGVLSGKPQTLWLR